jgi:hypothetical protein
MQNTGFTGRVDGLLTIILYSGIKNVKRMPGWGTRRCGRISRRIRGPAITACEAEFPGILKVWVIDVLIRS